MGTIMNDESRKKLLKQHKSERNSTVADRIKIVLLMDDGWDYDKIAKALFLDESTVRRNFQAYEKENRFISNHKGSTPILNEEESSQLSRDLENDVYTKIKDIQAHILEKFKKR